MDKIRSTAITESNIRNSYLQLIGLFLKRVIGGSAVFAAAANGDKKIFHKRFWGSFFKHHGLDSVFIWKIAK